MKKLQKFKGQIITWDTLQPRVSATLRAGYQKPRWAYFCEEMLRMGYSVSVKETLNTHSKYVRVYGAGDTSFLVRFSDHKPNKRRELNKDCDFFVGITHTGTRTTEQAIKATVEYFNAL